MTETVKANELPGLVAYALLEGRRRGANYVDCILCTDGAQGFVSLVELV